MCTGGHKLDEVGKACIENGKSSITMMQQRIEHIADSALRVGSETGLLNGLEAHAFLSLIEHPFLTTYKVYCRMPVYKLTGWFSLSHNIFAF